MTITVIGPGAIGCLVAAYLARAGEEVYLLDHRPERAALLEDRGIAVDGARGRFHTPITVTADPTEIGSAEVLILCVKACDTVAAVARLKDTIAPESHLLTLQNGLGNIETLGEFFDSDRILAGVTSHGATLLRVGQVRHAGYGEIWLGGVGGASSDLKARSKLRNLVATLNGAGLAAQVVDDIQSILWRKLVLNVAINALSAILGMPNGELLKIPACRKVMDGAVAEAVQVARGCGIILNLPEEIERVRAICRSTAGNISSMLQDVRRQKKTEIDQINGAVVRIAACQGMASPVNEVLTALIQGMESGYL
ncbi:MAG: 2-dehydropantoate 2-reductase [Deltaproteobacteria bacterium]|nr:2-dehydropantoate 2-reductase [Deltaproteobacteria bacterium]MBW2071314.1 2-dehydropantoate 2-reductase [Deltaproteobacteria bacterium]